MRLQSRQRETWELIDELRMEVEVEETLLDDGEPVSSFSVAQQVVKWSMKSLEAKVAKWCGLFALTRDLAFEYDDGARGEGGGRVDITPRANSRRLVKNWAAGIDLKLL